MAVIAMPSTPNFFTSTFRLTRAIAVAQSPFSGKVRTQEFDRVGWESEVALPRMNRSQAAEWQSFILRCKGHVNTFKFADPDALTNTGTYSTGHLILNSRVSNTNVALTVTNGNTFTAGASTFGSCIVGDYIHVTGMASDENNGTHKITTATSATVVVVDSALTNVSSTAGCKVQNNVKGAEGLNMVGSTNGAAGTIKKGDYLSILNATSASADPVQLLMVTEDAVDTSGSPHKFSVRTTPKLRTTPTNATYVLFTSPKGMFRMIEPNLEWSANNNSIYTMNFSCMEVI